MKKTLIKTVIATLVVVVGNLVNAQYVLKNSEDVVWFENIPQEAIITFVNNEKLIVGDYLYYAVNCFNSNTKKLSKNSKIAYVELVGKDGLVFKQKVRLKHGVGKGEFFLTPEMLTGNYKLIAYTQWMRNIAKKQFDVKDVVIINPFENLKFESVNETIQKKIFKETTATTIGLGLEKDKFSKREKINLNVFNKNGNSGNGNYTISVKKYDPISNMFDKQYDQKIVKNKSALKRIGDEIYLPEYNGEMITGVVLDAKSNLPIEGVEIALSMLDETSKQDIVYTNQKGIFYFHLKEAYKADNALVQIISKKKEKYILKINEHQPIEVKELNFTPIVLTDALKSDITKRSVHNQIENAFIENKKDTYYTYATPKEFFGNRQTTYLLDDYKRFSTVKETLTEIVDHAWFKKDENKKLIFDVRARGFDPYAMDDIKPLVVIDGAFVEDHEKLLNDSAHGVETISVLREEYYYGDKVFQGIVNIKTKKEDYYEKFQGDWIIKHKLFKPLESKRYFKQNYISDSEYSKIPDYRHQLLWIPEFRLNSQSFDLKFFTSDVTGQFEINLEGFTNAGEHVRVTKYFTVE